MSQIVENVLSRNVEESLNCWIRIRKWMIDKI